MIGAKGTTSQGDCYYFDVSKEGRLWQVGVESLIWQTTLQHPMRVVGKSGKTWILDPSPSNNTLFGYFEKSRCWTCIGIHPIIFGNIHILYLKLNVLSIFNIL